MKILPHFLRRYVSAPRISVVFHIYYEDVALGIIARLRNIKTPYALYVSHSHVLRPETISALKALNVPLKFLNTDNVGMDVYPFLAALEHFDLFDAGLVFKLHTKHGAGVVGEAWKNQLLDSTIGNGAQFDRNVRELEARRDLLMLGAESTYLSAHYSMKDNFSQISEVNLSCLYADLTQDWGFFAGTIFFAHSKIFKPFPRASAVKDRFVAGATKGDGEFAHACERIFGLLPRLYLGTVATVRPSQDEGVMNLTPVPARRLISKIMQDIHDSQSQ